MRDAQFWQGCAKGAHRFGACGEQTKEGRLDGAQDLRRARLLLLFRGAREWPITLSWQGVKAVHRHRRLPAGQAHVSVMFNNRM